MLIQEIETKEAKPKTKGVRRAPAADWRGADIHELWKHENSDRGVLSASGDAHELLGYACILREVSRAFAAEDDATWFDGCAFFLRGGYPFFAHLNRRTDASLRCTIFGGLSHGQQPADEVAKWLDELRVAANRAQVESLDVLVIDEVKSGGGLSRLCKLVSAAVDAWPEAVVVRLCYFAVRPDDDGSDPSAELAHAINKWNGDHCDGRLAVRIRSFVGPLLAYDSKEILGLRTLSQGHDAVERYEIWRSTGTNLRYECPNTKANVFEAGGAGSLAESLATLADGLVHSPGRSASRSFLRGVARNGCVDCHRLLARAAGLGCVAWLCPAGIRGLIRALALFRGD